jgi:hypothetical protein
MSRSWRERAALGLVMAACLGGRGCTAFSWWSGAAASGSDADGADESCARSVEGGRACDPAAAWLAREQAAHGAAGVLFSREKLRLFDGSVPGRPLVLCVLGECFNVSAGEQFYGPESSYACFAGNDGSRAYVTGEFTTEGCHDDVANFTGPELMGVEHWLDFYHKHAVYEKIGVLVGPYFDSAGVATSLRATTLQRAAQQREDEISLKILPGCNTKYRAPTPKEPGVNEVWCSSDSGGVTRHWIGMPRLESPKDDGKVARCVCVPEQRLSEAGLSVYPGCAPDANRCSV